MQAMQRAVRALRKTRIGNENDEGAEKMYKVVLTGWCCTQIMKRESAIRRGWSAS